MIIKVKVKPRSKYTKVERISKDEYVVYLKSPPIKGKANKELIDILSEYFDIPKSKIEIVRGYTFREKLVKISNL